MVPCGPWALTSLGPVPRGSVPSVLFHVERRKLTVDVVIGQLAAEGTARDERPDFPQEMRRCGAGTSTSPTGACGYRS
jgi:hypothetical protein